MQKSAKNCVKKCQGNLSGESGTSLGSTADGGKKLKTRTHKIENSYISIKVLVFWKLSIHCVWDFECSYTSSMKKLGLLTLKGCPFQNPTHIRTGAETLIAPAQTRA